MQQKEDNLQQRRFKLHPFRSTAPRWHVTSDLYDDLRVRETRRHGDTENYVYV